MCISLDIHNYIYLIVLLTIEMYNCLIVLTLYIKYIILYLFNNTN